MKRLLSIALLFAIATLCSASAQPQTSGTTLSLRARWDSGGAVSGTVSLGQVNLLGPDTILVTQTLSKGSASFTTPLSWNSIYNVTVTASNGSVLVKFPITTALINPSNLTQASINIVFSSATNTVKSANVSVSMNF